MLVPCRKIHEREGLTRGTVVADSEVRSDILTDVCKTARAVLSSAANLGSTLPDELREVAPLLEVGHVGVGLAVKVVVVANLTVVEELSDDSRNVVSLDTSGDVLTITTTVDIHAVGVDASGGDLLGGGSKLRVPFEVACRVVGTVDVVVGKDDLLVGGSLTRGSGDGAASLCNSFSIAGQCRRFRCSQ